MNFYRPAIRAWLHDVCEAVGCLLAADYIERLGDTIHDATKTIRDLEADRRHYARALAIATNHPCMRGAVDQEPTDDDMAELAFVQTVGDILWLTGEDA